MLSSEILLISQPGLEGLEVPVSTQSLENKIDSEKDKQPKIFIIFYIRLLFLFCYLLDSD